jgi:hypothetical protein
LINLLDGSDDQFAVLSHRLQIGFECPQGINREFRVLAILMQLINLGLLLRNRTLGFDDV